jgi:hypothetical protein
MENNAEFRQPFTVDHLKPVPGQIENLFEETILRTKARNLRHLCKTAGAYAPFAIADIPPFHDSSIEPQRPWTQQCSCSNKEV